MIINKFRGDKSLLDPGIKWIENKLKLPMVGVIPYYRDIFIEEEDSVNLEKQFSKQINSNSSNIKIAVLYLPHISNFTDFNALELEQGVDLLYVRKITELADFNPDVIIIPGSKSTINDLLYLRNSGIESEILRRFNKGTIVFGVCGGYQMLGFKITDKYKTESKDFESIKGIGILDIETEFSNEKYTRQVDFSFNDKLSDFFKSCNFDLPYKFDAGFNMNGYEIHMGISKSNTKIRRSEDIIKNKEFLTISLFKIRSKTKIPERITANNLNRYSYDHDSNYEDGVVSINLVKGNIAMGTYVHGIFDSTEVRKFLISLARYVKISGSEKAENKTTIGSEKDNYFSYNELKEKQYDKLADLFRENMDMKMFYNILNNS